MWTKQQIIEQAYDELALAGYVYDLDPDQLESALRRLDTMMAAWSAVGISLGYLLPASPDDSNLDDASGIPDTAIEAAYMNLAVKIAASRGKNLTPQTLAAARRGYDQLLGAAARAAARPVPMPNTLPRGAGNKPWRTGTPFFPGPAETLDTETGAPITVS
jgi:hypothetical protein